MSPDPVRVPTLGEITAGVRARPPVPAVSPKPPVAGKAGPQPALSHEAEAFLWHAALPAHWTMELEQRWAALGVRSGSKKQSVLNELRSLGFIRLERKGKRRAVHIYGRAWEHLRLRRPAGMGRGGTLHRVIVRELAKRFAAKGCEVYIEKEMGAQKTRVDMVIFGKGLIVGCELGLTSAAQELKNLRDDLRTGVLDKIIFLSPDARMVRMVEAGAQADPELAAQLHRIVFHVLNNRENTP